MNKNKAFKIKEAHKVGIFPLPEKEEAIPFVRKKVDGKKLEELTDEEKDILADVKVTIGEDVLYSKWHMKTPVVKVPTTKLGWRWFHWVEKRKGKKEALAILKLQKKFEKIHK